MAYTPKITEASAAFHGKMFPGMVSPFSLSDPEFFERIDNFAFDEVVNQVNLDDTTRYLCWLATVLGAQSLDEYKIMLMAALNNGITPVQAKEVVYQAVAYLGIARTFPFINATNEVFEQAGISVVQPEQATTEPTKESRLAAGEAAQIAIFGESMADFKNQGNPDYPWINEWLVANCFGDWYSRGGLDLKQRELITFCYIAAQGGCDSQLKSHAAGNIHIGNDKNLLVRVVSSNLPFIGYPRSLNALAAIEEASKQS